MARSRPVKLHVVDAFLGNKSMKPPRKFPWWLLRPAVACSRGNIVRGGLFLYKRSCEFPWWLNPAGKNPG